MKKKLKIVGICFLLFLTLGGLTVYDYSRYYDGKLHIIFCNVGQGDAILIRTPGRKNILVDGGPDKSVLTCLSNHLPFWERTLHLMFLTHPHDDHLSGMHYVIERYITLMFATVNVNNTTFSYKDFLHALEKYSVSTKSISAGDSYRLPDGVVISILGPSRSYVGAVSPNGIIGEKNEQASLIQHISYGTFDIVLTGDSQVNGLLPILSAIKDRTEVIQVPHHGSRTGLTKRILQELQPSMAVISVGKNTYGHPTKEILHLLSDEMIKTVRTDQLGDIEIISDGKDWFVRNDKITL